MNAKEMIAILDQYGCSDAALKRFLVKSPLSQKQKIIAIVKSEGVRLAAKLEILKVANAEVLGAIDATSKTIKQQSKMIGGWPNDLIVEWLSQVSEQSRTVAELQAIQLAALRNDLRAADRDEQQAQDEASFLTEPPVRTGAAPPVFEPEDLGDEDPGEPGEDDVDPGFDDDSDGELDNELDDDGEPVPPMAQPEIPDEVLDDPEQLEEFVNAVSNAAATAATSEVIDVPAGSSLGQPPEAATPQKVTTRRRRRVNQ
jgi:hypothetical protein